MQCLVYPILQNLQILPIFADKNKVLKTIRVNSNKDIQKGHLRFQNFHPKRANDTR
jgi:hypothetical protein